MRKTIAVLTDYLDHLAGGYETELRRGFEEACAARDFNLLLIVGRPLGDAPHDRVYDLVGPSAIDAAVLLTAGLAINQGLPAVERLIPRYSGLPLISLGMELVGVPSIVIDNRSGLSETIDHLIVAHGRRRLLFLGGPEYNADARSRFDVYREALDRHGIPFEPELIELGDFTTGSGATAMLRALERTARFDAVVAANDGMAIGALGVLQERGFAVPADVSVTGFDDLVMARFTDPPLTTIRQPIERMASLAIEFLGRRMQGDSVPDRTEVSVECVRRSSCGCGPKSSQRRPVQLPDAPALAREWVGRQEAELTRSIVESLDLPQKLARELATGLARGLRSELEGNAGALRAALETAMAAAADRIELHEELQDVISLLRSKLPYSSPELEELWHQARCVISAGQARTQAELRLAIERSYWRALRSGERFSTALDWPSLKAALGEELPHAARSACVSLTVPGAPGELEALFCLIDGRPEEPATRRFPAARLVPVLEAFGRRRRTLYVLPLVSETELLGIAVLEALPHTGTHEMLREQLGFAVKSVVLHQELMKKTALHERSVQERAATAKRMNALSVLAGGVAHDLNNALAPLVALPQVMRRQLDAMQAGASDHEFREDLLRIESSALRAAQTIKDLLTLGRQGRSGRESLDLNRMVQNALLNETAFIQQAQARGVSVEIQLQREPLLVSASEAQLARVVSNLLRNAVEAVEGAGVVEVRTATVPLEQPLLGYESIEPGDYACLSIQDSGAGIDATELGSIFEPFYSNKRLSDHSGSGLGLAIVHGVVKDHQGFLDVESTPGAGSTFTIYLPRATRPVKKRSSAPPPRRGAARILVLDDDPTQLHTVGRVLGPLGYSVTSADTGVSAYGHFADESGSNPGRSPYDLVVVDMQLRDGDDGLAVFERMRQLYPALKGIVVSGHAPSERVGRAVDEGIGWLSKPYAADELIRTVERTLAAEVPESGREPSASDERGASTPPPR